MPASQKRVRLTESLILDIMQECGPRRDELIIGFLGLQGLRPRQISTLLAGDVDFEEQTLTLVQGDATQPAGWPRTPENAVVVDLHPNLARSLRGYSRYDRNAPQEPGDPILTKRPGSNAPIDPEQVNHVVRKVSREVGSLFRVSFTVADLRWSCAKNLSERGVSFEVIAHLMGHANADATRRFLERGFD